MIKKIFILFKFFIVLIVAILAWITIIQIKESPPLSTARVEINGITIPVEIADTDAKRAKGLSNRTSLDQQSGMLFVFEKSGVWIFWMPDMNFPLDIIWIGEDKKIIGIEENTPPLKDKLNSKTYSPQKPAQYVLELNAGFTKAYGIRPGDEVRIFQ